MTAPGSVSSGWLALREPADAAARSQALVDELTRDAPEDGSWIVHDLACGTGSMGRWLAPRLHGTQHWVMHDRDRDLLDIAATVPPGPAAGGAPVTWEVRQSDITLLRPDDLAGATLTTASALLDMLTEDELRHLVAISGAVGCHILVTMSVVGRVDLTPAEPLDSDMADAFNAHQRRVTTRGRLLGPDAVEAAVDGYRRRGTEVIVRPSPWRLGAADTELATEWLTGWVDAACEQQPELAAEAPDYVDRRLAQANAGKLTVSVDHADLLVRP